MIKIDKSVRNGHKPPKIDTHQKYNPLTSYTENIKENEPDPLVPPAPQGGRPIDKEHKLIHTHTIGALFDDPN